MIQRNILSYGAACLLCLYGGYEAHHLLHEARRPLGRAVMVTLQDGKIEVLRPGDDTGAHGHKQGPPAQGVVSTTTSTSLGSMFASSGSDIGPLVRMWGRLPDGRLAFSEYHQDGAFLRPRRSPSDVPRV